MKQIFTSLITALFTATIYSQTTITQNQVPNTVIAGSSLSCNSGSYTRENFYIRAFRLEDFGITSDFTVNNIAFGVESVNGTFPVEVNLYELTGGISTGTLTQLGTTNVNVSPANNLGMANTGTTLSGLIPAGKSFVVEIHHNGADVTPKQSFFMGGNSGGQSGPSYFVAPPCGINIPTATGTGPLASYPQIQWVMTITGQTAALGVTEIINSPDLQIFPNPVEDILKFRFSNNLKSEAIEIFDMNGRVITSIQNNKNVNEVNMHSYPAGNYILKVKGSDGKLYVKKLIKK